MKFTHLIKDYIDKKLLSDSEPAFLVGEFLETNQQFAGINKVFKAPKNIFEKLDLDKKSLWQLYCAAVFYSSRPLKNGQKKRVEVFKKYIHQYESTFI